MKLSIFPDVKPLPTKTQKKTESFKTSKPYEPEVKEFYTDDDLIDIVCGFAWSPSIFNGFRNQSNFVSTDLMVLDIDDGMKIEEAEEIIEEMEVTCLCLPSTSHSPEAHRFRLIFPLSRTIYSEEEFVATMEKLAERFPADRSCIGDSARFYFGCRDDDGFYYEGDLLKPMKPTPQKPDFSRKRDYDGGDTITVGESLEELVIALYGEKRKKVPESIAYFLENAPDNLDGEWFVSSNAFLFTCGLSGLEYDNIIEVFYSLYPHEELTEKKVARMIEDGYNSREEEPEKEGRDL